MTFDRPLLRAVSAGLAATALIALTLTPAAAASPTTPTYDITTLAGKVASLRGTAGLQVRFSAFLEEEAQGEASGSAPAPITPTNVLSSPLDNNSITAPNVLVNQDVHAAPQNETSIAAAGIEFDGYPSFVARETGTDKNDVFLMLCFGDTRIVHTTLHVGVAQAVALITRERVDRVIGAADAALRRLGVTAPKIYVSGLNPHAGEGGLFGREEIEIISPAIADAARKGVDVSGPFGADTMFHKKGCDAFIVMLHDQGHITAKLLAHNATAGLTIGTPILF